MPGLTARVARHSASEDIPRFAAAQASMLYRHDDERIELHGQGLSAGYVKRPAYPVQRLGHDPETFLLFEGRIYNKDMGRIERELLSLAREVQGRPAAPPEAIRRWITDSDGEYVIAMGFPAQRRLVVFTDPLGRLPLYHYADDEQILIARECKFILGLKPPPCYDPIGCAQSIWLGYPLGERTLFRDVERSPAAALIEAHVADETLRTSVRPLLTLNFDDKDEAVRAGKAADALVDEFVETCGLRASHSDGGSNIVALSGGHDSRAVVGALARAGAPFNAYTGARPGQIRDEVSGAREVADTVGIGWETLETPRAGLPLHEELVRMKDGHNHTAVSGSLDNMKSLLSKWGSDATFMTGDGGDKALPDLRPPHRLRSQTALLQELEQLHGYGGVPRTEAGALFGVSADELLTDLERVLATYPEAGPVQRAVHYMVYERGAASSSRERTVRAISCGRRPLFSRSLSFEPA